MRRRNLVFLSAAPLVIAACLFPTTALEPPRTTQFDCYSSGPGECSCTSSYSPNDGGCPTAPTSGTVCCRSSIVEDCQCTTPVAGCTKGTDTTSPPTCSCGNVVATGDAGATDTCSLPTLPWTGCCLAAAEGYCVCYANGKECYPNLETPVASCSTTGLGTPAGCVTDEVSCRCDALGSGPASCPATLEGVCCLDTTSGGCNCSYGGECATTQQRVASCTTAIVQPLLKASCDITSKQVDKCR